MGLNNVALIQLKMVLLAPIPRASVSTAVSAKPGARRNCRNAYQVSASSWFIAFSSLSGSASPELPGEELKSESKSAYSVLSACMG
jgi:hypothetical protein